jgi:hypothetical protein
MIDSVAGTALPLPELERTIFGETPLAERATAALIALATFAQRQRDRRVLLPTRLHMFFRGLRPCLPASIPNATMPANVIRMRFLDACTRMRANAANVEAVFTNSLHTANAAQLSCGAIWTARVVTSFGICRPEYSGKVIKRRLPR